MNTIIVSDLHIGNRHFMHENFNHFLDHLTRNQDIVLNGDIIDTPSKRLEPAHQHVLDRIEHISHKQKVVWVLGNHENGHQPDNLGNIIFKERYAIKNRLVITHGDKFDDIMPGHRFFMKTFRLMHHIRVKLGAKPVHVAHYAKKWGYLYNILRKNVMINAVNFADKNGYQAVACGHTHYAEEINVRGTRYFNTGAWTEPPLSYIQVTDDGINLKTYLDGHK